MIFLLDCSVSQIASANPIEIEQLFTKLIDADRAGRHYFVVTRQLCNWAVSNVQLSGRDRGHLIGIQQKFAQRGGLPQASKSVVKLLIGGQGISFDGTSTFSIGHREFIAGEFSNTRTSLIVEDINDDIDLYDCIFSEVVKQTNVPNYAFHAVHGGGGSTPRVFSSEIAGKRVAVCVVDSDKLAPMDKKSDTANQILSIKKRHNVDESDPAEPFIGDSFITVGRELENYLPYEEIKNIDNYRGHSSFPKLDAKVKQSGELDIDQCFWQHFDVKEGLNGSGVYAKYENGLLSEESFNWICQRLGCTEAEINSVSIDGFGASIVRVFLACDQALKGFHQFTRTQYWQHLFLQYFERILWFFAAPPAERI